MHKPFTVSRQAGCSSQAHTQLRRNRTSPPATMPAAHHPEQQPHQAPSSRHRFSTQPAAQQNPSACSADRVTAAMVQYSEQHLKRACHCTRVPVKLGGASAQATAQQQCRNAAQQTRAYKQAAAQQQGSHAAQQARAHSSTSSVYTCQQCCWPHNMTHQQQHEVCLELASAEQQQQQQRYRTGRPGSATAASAVAAAAHFTAACSTKHRQAAMRAALTAWLLMNGACPAANRQR